MDGLVLKQLNPDNCFLRGSPLVQQLHIVGLWYGRVMKQLLLYKLRIWPRLQRNQRFVACYIRTYRTQPANCTVDIDALALKHRVFIIHIVDQYP